jgi:hypothetical protein
LGVSSVSFISWVFSFPFITTRGKALIFDRESLSWYTNAESGPAVDEATERALAAATRSFKPEELHTYQNFSRDSSLESRFGSQERVEKLQALKKKWDPNGVFTKVFL